MNIFEKVKMAAVKKSTFDLSHDVKTSFSMGELVPTTVMDVIPGDRVTISVENMLRFAPLISPVMHKVNVKTDYFFVPNRILWPEWEQWITGESDVAAPYINTSQIRPGTLGDYLGYNNDSATLPIPESPLALAAYIKIYDEYYRDQNLQDPLFESLPPGELADTVYNSYIDQDPLKRAWRHDYFTSALPFAQKGDEVLLPIGEFNDVEVVRNDNQNTLLRPRLENGDGTPLGSGEVTTGPAGRLEGEGGGVDAWLNPRGTLTAQTSDLQAEQASINNLRRGFRLQEWLEKNARGGTRYVENILAHFGVRSSDARLQRPEYIGGSKQGMTISEVLSTAQTLTNDGENPVGQMAGHGISVGGGNKFTFTAEEHGFIIGIVSVLPETAYQQGVPRMHTRLDRFDYAWPTFAHLGEQEILNKEIYTDQATAEALNEVFGYIPRYSEYRYMPSRVHGSMKDSLSFWHLGRQFDNAPALNEDFISADPSTRIFAVTDESEDHIFAHIFNNIRATRCLPKYGTPTF